MPSGDSEKLAVSELVTFCEPDLVSVALMLVVAVGVIVSETLCVIEPLAVGVVVAVAVVVEVTLALALALSLGVGLGLAETVCELEIVVEAVPE